MALKKKLTASGAKARQRSDNEDRTLAYRDWRREVVGRGHRRSTCYTSDLDQIEYIIVDNIPIPVAILELTRYDHDEHDGQSQSWAKYKSAILDRYFFRDAQGRFVKVMAERMGVPAFIVLFRKDLGSFYLFDMIDPHVNWVHMEPDEYKEWLCQLKSDATIKIKREKKDG